VTQRTVFFCSFITQTQKGFFLTHACMILFRWKKAIKFRGSLSRHLSLSHTISLSQTHTHTHTQTHTHYLSLSLSQKFVTFTMAKFYIFYCTKNHGFNFMQVLEIIWFIGILLFAFYNPWRFSVLASYQLFIKYFASMAFDFQTICQIKLIRNFMKNFSSANTIVLFWLFLHLHI
jgi:hypothetical protein